MKWRLVAALLGLTLVVLFVHDYPLASYLRTVENDRIITALERDSFVLAGRSEEILEEFTPEQAAWLNGVVSQYSQKSGARVIITDSTGLLVSSSDAEDLVGTSYLSRPEITQALAGEVNSGRRFSQTLNQELLYVAVPVLNGEKINGAVRVTYPASTVDAAVTERLKGISTVAGITLLLATFVAILLAGTVTRRLSELKRTTEKFRLGDYSARAEVTEGAPEIRALAASFNTMADQLTSMIAQQRAFAGDASHQLRTPLTALQLRLERASELIESDPRGAAERLEAALDEAERLQRLVEGLLVLSRAENNENVETQVFDLVKIAKERVESWKPLADESEVTLKSDFPGSAMIRAIPGAIEQVIDNYLDNALEIIPAKSKLTVQIISEHEYFSVHVLDEGPGMSPEDLAKAFNRFWRGRSDSHGSGLGLAIVDRLLRAGGGYAQLSNRPTGGLDAAGYFLKAN